MANKSDKPAVKACRKCSEVKPHGDFPANVKVSDGLSSWCRDCHNAAVRESRAKHRERYNAAARERYRATRQLPEPRPCLECDEMFTPKRSDGVFCCNSCRERWRWKGTKGYQAMMARAGKAAA